MSEISKELHQELTTFVDVYYTTKGSLPTPVHFKLKYNLKLTEADLAERFNPALKSRGLKQYSEPKPEPEQLKTEPQVKEPVNDEEKALLEELAEFVPLAPVGVIAAHLIADVGDKRSTAAKLKSLELTTADWNGFLADPDFNAFFCKLVDNHFATYSSKAKIGLGKQLEIGELNAIKYFHEFTGEFKPQQAEVLNLQMIISQLMEVIAKFLSPDQIVLIADQIEGIVSNNGQRSNIIETQVKELMRAGEKEN